MVSPPEEGGMKEASYKENNMIVIDSTLVNILPPQLKNMTSLYKVMCGCGCCISSKRTHSSFLPWYEYFLKKLKDQICNVQNRSSGEMEHCLFEIYKIMPCHMEIICFKQHLTFQWQQCVHIHNKTTHYHIVDVF